MENENLKPVQELTPFTKMIMTIGTLPSSFYSSMSYYESMVWLYEYLKNQVIPTVNNNAEAVSELQAKYIELKSYIDNYFENLDVQEEINKKLDEMAEDGSLTNLIKGYVDPIYQSYETEINNEIFNQNTEIENQTLAINEFKTQINNQITTINNKVDSATSGSPAGVYDTVSDLTTADPNHNKIYVVAENGKWYYYDTSTTSWTAGGDYQSSVNSDSVDYILYNMLPVIHGNLFNKDTATQGKYLDGADGHEATNANYGYSDYIKVFDPDELEFVDMALDMACYCYNSEKTVLGRNSITYYKTNGFLANTEFIRFNFAMSQFNSVKVFLNESDKTYQLQNGEIKLDSNYIYNNLLNDEIEELKNNMLPVIHGNLFNKDTVTSGKVLAGNDGHEENRANYNYSDYILTNDLENIQFIGTNLIDACYCYNEYKTVLEYKAISYYLSNGFPENTKFIRINVPDSYLNTTKIFNNSLEKDFNLNYGIVKLLDKNIIKSYNIYVGTGQTYTTLNDALEYANSIASEITPVNIYLEDGEYNVLPTSLLETVDNTYVGLILNNYVNIYGSSMEKTIIKAELPADLTDYNVIRNNISTLNAYKNNIIKNCTIIAKNMRYCLHNDDYKSMAVEDAYEEFENVKFLYKQNSAGIESSQIPVGIGAFNGRITKFKNCIFKTESSRLSILLHNNVNSPKSCYWLFDNCDFINTNGTNSIKLSSAGSNQDELIELKGNYLSGNILFGKEQVYEGTEPEFIVRGYANEIPNLTWESPIIEDDTKIRLL